MVLGADPDAKVKEWPDDPKPQGMEYRAAPNVREMTDYFAYHREMKMSQRCDSDDKVILNRFFSRRYEQGFTKPSLIKMVDRFFQSWGSEYDQPALAFTSTKMQDKLLIEAKMVKQDDVLDWMLGSMSDSGPFEDNKEMRKAVLLAGDCVNRYPDVVADILRMEGTPEVTRKRLSLLNAIIKAKVEHQPIPHGVRMPVMPAELTGAGRLRPQQDSFKKAMAGIPRKKERREV